MFEKERDSISVGQADEAGSGALDYFEKPVRHQDLLELISAALAQDARQRQQLCHHRADAAKYATLTGRERRVMSLLVAGKVGKQLADELGISDKTMEKFRGKVMQKMVADSVAQLVFAGINLGLVSANGQNIEPTPEGGSFSDDGGGFPIQTVRPGAVASAVLCDGSSRTARTFCCRSRSGTQHATRPFLAEGSRPPGTRQRIL